MDDQEYYACLLAMRARFYERHAGFEKDWVKSELSKTDFIHMPDATVGGELIAGTDKYTQLMSYRTSLRAYNCTTDDRPVRPEWFKN